jgi:hypothetical protein
MDHARCAFVAKMTNAAIAVQFCLFGEVDVEQR